MYPENSYWGKNQPEDQSLDDLSFDEENYDDLLFDSPYDFMELSDADLRQTPADELHPYAEELAYLEDIEGLTNMDNDEDPPASLRE